jgi:hypothetical protein
MLQVRRARAEQGIKYAPLWFKQTDATSLWHTVSRHCRLVVHRAKSMY